MKKIICLFMLFILFSCTKENKKPVLEKEPSDSIVVLTDKNQKIGCIYRFSNEKEKTLKEKISYFEDGTIDYANSAFAEIIGNDLIFHSSYAKKYPIPDKRFLEFIGTTITNQPDHVQILKQDTVYFRGNSRIKNYKSILPPYGKILETIILDTLIREKNQPNKKIIRTIEYEIDLRDLLIDRAEEIKKNYTTERSNSSE